MSLSPGASVGPYTIVDKLGAGGMGEVFRARDSRLNRDVAVKVLPASVAADQERLARFTREAQTLAALNHPNIAAIYGVEVYDTNARALIMELVEGRELSSLIATLGQAAPAALPLADLLSIARQIADALETAHEIGIVHRDLKPANVKVRADGTVKVLDFGLARTLDAAGGQDPANSPTITSPATAMGVILGTAAYMAPEQARGRTVDRRADIWSFGVVLFEMLTGHRLFAGDDVSVTLAGVLKDEPDWGRLPASTPAPLLQLLRRCLVKDPKQRLQSIGEARILIDGLISGSVPMVPASPAGGRHPLPSFVPWALAMTAVVALAATLAMWAPWRSGGDAGGGPLRMSILMPSDLRVRNYQISPDGSRLVLRAQARTDAGPGEPARRLYVRPLDAFGATPIAGTDGAEEFAFSPDGRWLAVLVTAPDNPADRRLLKVPADGSSPPVMLVTWSPNWFPYFVWLEDGDVLTSVLQKEGPAFIRIPGGGGAPGPPIPVRKIENAGPFAFSGQALPGDAGVFAVVGGFGARGYQVNLGLLDPKTGEYVELIKDAADPHYLGSGHLVFSRGDTVLAVAFDLERRSLSGDVMALEAGVSSMAGPADFTASTTGTIAYMPSGPTARDRRMVLVDARGAVTPFLPQTAGFTLAPSASPDGSRSLTTVLNQTGTYELWLADSARGTLRRLPTPASADASNPLWSPDGLSMVYVREGLKDGDGLYLQRMDTAAEPRLISEMPKNSFILGKSWLPDSSGLIVARSEAGGNRDLFLLPVAKDGTAAPLRPLRPTAADEEDAMVSPDGRLIAFSSDESGRKEVYVAAYSNGQPGPAVMISDGADGAVQWAGPRRLVYDTASLTLVSVEISTVPALSASVPAVLHDLAKLRITGDGWEVRRDGRLLAIQRSESEGTIESINVILNWGDDGRRRLQR